MNLPRPALGFLLGLAGVTIFGGSLPMTRLAVADLSPLFLTAGRGAGAGLVALAVLLVLGRPIPDRTDLLRIALASLMLVWGFPILMALGMRTVPASHGGVILALLPVATALAATLFAGERPSTGFWLASLAGAALVGAFTLRAASGDITADHLWLVAAVALCGIGYAVSGALGRRLASWEVISWLVVLQLPVTVPLTLLTWPRDIAAISGSAWIGFFYLMLLSQYLGFFFWHAGLALGGVAKVGQVQLLQTFVTLAIAWLVNGEAIAAETVAFAIAVVAVVVAAQRTHVTRSD